jgi:hypothetical protein
VYEHERWVTVKVCPAIVAVPVLDVAPVFAAMLSETAPAPLPVCPEAMVIQGVSLTAVQLQPFPANTSTVAVPAPEDSDTLRGDNE